MTRGFFLGGLWSLLLVITGLAVSTHHLQDNERIQTFTVVRGLQKVAVPLIEKANHTKDDLVVQNLLQALAEFPGVGVACVVSADDDKILAHSQPSLIGGRFEHTDGRSLWSAPLNEGATKWGRLLITYSDRQGREARRIQIGLETIAAFAMWLAFLMYTWVQHRDKQEALHEAEGWKHLEEDARRQLKRVQTQAEDDRRASEARLEWLCQWLRVPAVVLDQRQRVVAVPPHLGRLIPAAETGRWVGRSWHEIPALEACGLAIQQSIRTPHQPIESPAGGAPARWSVQSYVHENAILVGTLVTLIE